jgi:uncharacterized protein YggE
MATADDRRTVTVSAQGVAMAEPDMAAITVGVVADAPTAGEAVTRNNAQMQKLIDAMKQLGIEAKDIRTQQFQVDPQYAQPRDGKSPTLTGYRVHNAVRLTVRDLARLGAILDGAITAGANQVAGIEFRVSGEDALRDKARRDAIATAQRRARLFAEAAGAELGKALTISEDGVHPMPRPMGRAAMASVPIEPGSQALEVNVTVTFELK